MSRGPSVAWESSQAPSADLSWLPPISVIGSVTTHHPQPEMSEP